MPFDCLGRDFTLYDDSLAWQRKRFFVDAFCSETRPLSARPCRRLPLGGGCCVECQGFDLERGR